MPVSIIQVWIPLSRAHLLPVNHFCHVAVKNFTSKEYTGGYSTHCFWSSHVSPCVCVFAHIPAFTLYIAHTHTDTRTVLFTHTDFLGLSFGCLCYMIQGSLVNESFLDFFSLSPPSAMRLLISSMRYFKGALLKPVS